MKVKLSYLTEKIQDAIQGILDGEYWVSAQVTNSKCYESNKRCYLTLTEIENGAKVAEMKAVFWHTHYDEIAKFEKATGQKFKDGIEIVCKVKVRFNKVYGLTLEVFQIDIAHAVGSMELQRRQTIERLIKEGVCDARYGTNNNKLPLPMVIKRIALITAPGSDGQRDFIQELTRNKHGYTFEVKEFLTTIQGDNAHIMILEQLKLVEVEKFDAVAIVRGGGSQSDFKPFDDYELCRYIAQFPVPIFTGIGHDRNQSLVDLMAREQKTPTKVASVIVDHNFEFENKVIEFKDKLGLIVWNRMNSEKNKIKDIKTSFFNLVKDQIRSAGKKVDDVKRDILTLAQGIIRDEKSEIKEVKNKISRSVRDEIKNNRGKIDNIKSVFISRIVSDRLSKATQSLSSAKKIIKLSDPQNILNQGFAIVKSNNKLVTSPTDLVDSSEMEITLKDGVVLAIKKEK